MNFVKNSINFTAGVNSVKTENDAIAPNGVKEATRFFSPASVGSTTFDTPLNPITFVTDKIYCRSIFVKPVSDNPEPRLFPFIIGGENTQHRLGIFNLKTKIFTWQYAQAGEVGTIFQANYKEYDNGWMRVWWNTKKTSTNTLGLNSYHMGAYGGGNNGSMWVWGAQVEEVANLSSEPGEYEQTGGDSLIFYNRDSNITELNPISSLTYIPTYGSRVQFSCNTNKYETFDGYFNQIPLSINSLTAKFDLKFDLNEEESKKLINFIENKNGVYDITFSDSSSIYKNIDGFCTEYAINRINRNHYEIAISLDVKDVPNLFNWYSMSYVKPNYKTWSNNILYKKYDILQYNTTNILNKLNSFYYCGYNHDSKEGIDTEPGDSISPWRQDFFFEPDLAMQNSVNLKVEKINFKNSFSQNIKTKKNIATTDFTYKFSNITTQKARAILHFLENKGGYRRFRVNMDSVYNKPKVFYAPSWNHTWKFEDSHDIEVQLIEDPLGVIPKD
jgi:phage-related protein